MILWAAQCPTADAQFTIEVHDWNGNIVTDAEVTARTVVKTDSGPQRRSIGENRWNCVDGRCTINRLDPNTVELEVTVTSACLHIPGGQTFNRCYSDLQRGYLLIDLKRPTNAPYYSQYEPPRTGSVTVQRMDQCCCGCCWCWSPPPPCMQTNAITPYRTQDSRAAAPYPILVATAPVLAENARRPRLENVSHLSPGLLARLCRAPYHPCYDPLLPPRIRSEPIAQITKSPVTVGATSVATMSKHQGGVDVMGPLILTDPH